MVDKENRLSYYGAYLLKQALIEMGYPEVDSFRKKKDLIAYVKRLIAEPIDVSDDEPEEDIIVIDGTLRKLREI